MKKIILLTGAILMMSVTANACGGITVKGNSGASYCLSKHMMNWYSAYAWCDGQGMNLIDLNSVCKSYSSCPELNLSSEQKDYLADNGISLEKNMWTNTASSNNLSFCVDFYNHITDARHNYNYGGLRTVNLYALCH